MFKYMSCKPIFTNSTQNKNFCLVVIESIQKCFKNRVQIVINELFTKCFNVNFKILL